MYKPKQNPPIYTTELFKIIPENLPPLFAYELKIRSVNHQVRIGRKLADRLMRALNGHWVWTDSVIVTNTVVSSSVIEQTIRNIRIKEVESFKDIAGIEQLPNWTPTSQAQADFVAQGLFSDFSKELHDALLPPIDLNGKAKVVREYDVRGWVVDAQPAISIAIESRVIFKDDLKTYLARLSNKETILGLYVSDKVRFDNGTVLKGEIMSIAGTLDGDITRQDLIDIAQREASKTLIKNAAPNEYVVRVGHNEYEYVASALQIIVFPKHYKRFGIDTRKAQRTTWISPPERAQLVKKVSSIARKHKLIGDTYTSKTANVRFAIGSDYYYDPTILLGKNIKIQYEGGSSLLREISRSGVYERLSDIGNVEHPLKIGVINASQNEFSTAQEALQQQLNKMGFRSVEFQISKTDGISRIDFEHAINKLQSLKPHIMIAIIPGSDSFD